MNKPEKKPRKASVKQARRSTRLPNSDIPANGSVAKRHWSPSPTHPHPVGRALAAAVKAFKGDKSGLAAYLGMHKPNLSRALLACRRMEEGSATSVSWPVEHVLKLGAVSGVPLHELAPGIYEPQMKVKRFKPEAVA